MALPPNLVKLIESLRRAHPGGRSVADLAGELDIQAWRAAELLGRLKSLGVAVEEPAPGRLATDPAATPLIGDLIELGLAPVRVGRSVVVFPRVGSTNDVCRQATARRDSDGLVVLAESQSAGRGRRGRVWHDAPGASLLLSLLLLDEPGGEGLTHRLMMAAAVALAEALDEGLGVPAVIRWPNDLYVHGRKLAGVLVEAARSPSPAAGAPLFDVVIGIGVNCNQQADDFNFPPAVRTIATSLAVEVGRRVDRTAVARALLGRLDGWLAGGDACPSLDELHRAYLQRMDHSARRVRVHHDGRTFEGTVRDVDPLAGLIVELGGGVAHFDPSDTSVEWLAG
ncbi:MAG: Bifunctional ligase/repressor BirA [Phycisphaerae bacterium]|nr:Bifunctional ligase/repressor BirA [Phycisphaerae bacterium]